MHYIDDKEKVIRKWLWYCFVTIEKGARTIEYPFIESRNSDTRKEHVDETKG
jgi:hypothetical protein